MSDQLPEMNDPMLVVAEATECEPARRIWGTGGWQPPDARPPEGREALDWLTLARLSGWGVSVTRRAAAAIDEFDEGLDGGSRWVIVACDPDGLGDGAVTRLASRLASEPLLVVARAAGGGSAFARLAGVARGGACAPGRGLYWTGPGAERRWECREEIEACALGLTEEARVWATLDGAPCVAGRRVGRGAVVTLAFDPSRARDACGAATSLLRHALVWGACAPVAWLEWEGSLVLRMDDPGGAQNVHCRGWSYPKLGEEEWARIGADLGRRRARLSVAYVAGWMDDGDERRGRLRVGGAAVGRVPGRVHPSPRVRYLDVAGHAPGTVHDYEAEYRGIQALRARGLAEVEQHGFTHMHPDGAAWAGAPDAYEDFKWYRELGHGASAALAARRAAEHPLALGFAALREHFGVSPTTLICPGDEWTEEALGRALDLGYTFVNDYHLAIRDRGRFCWTSHVASPYLNEPAAAWFDAGLPVVGYFHDREPAVEGVGWVSDWLNAWAAAGARRLLDFRELAAAVGRTLTLEARAGDKRPVLDVAARAHAPALVRPLEILLRVPGGPLPARVTVRHDGAQGELAVEVLAGGSGRVTVPCGGAWADPVRGAAVVEGEPGLRGRDA